MRNKNNKNMFVLILLLCIITLGFATLSTTLSINGNTTIKGNTWDVFFTNVVVKDGSVDADTPVITDKTTVNFEVELDKTGDFYEFIVDVVNGGTIDAMIDNIDVKPVLSAEQKKYLDFSVTYENGNAISTKQLLSKGETKKVKVSLKYKDDITSKDLPSDNTELDIKIKVNYVQADDSAVEVHDKNYLMIVDTTNGGALPAFGGPILKNQVEKIYTLDSITVPENAIASWDVSELKNESVMAYTLDEDNNGMYELYLGQEDGVLANPNSTKLFNYYTAVDTIDLSNFDTSNVIDMPNMFNYCSSLTNLNVSNFDTSNVIDMAYMFNYCSSLTNLNVSNFDTSKVTTMRTMFQKCEKLVDLNVSNFDTSNVIEMAYMFSYCSSLTNLNVSNFDTSKVTTMLCMFNYCSSLTNLKGLENWDTSNVTSMVAMFCGSNGVGDGKITNESFAGLKNWNVSKVTDFTCMFYGQGTNLTTLDLSKWDTSSAISLNHMFADNFKLTSLDLSKWKTSNVVTTYNMFNDCSSLTSVGDISHWDVRNLIDMGCMFTRCSSLVGKLDLSGWVTPKLRGADSIFIGCSKLTEIDISGLNTSLVNGTKWSGAGTGIHYAYDSSSPTMENIFNGCTNLSKVYVGNGWQTSQANTTGMFTNAGITEVTLK